MSTIRNISRIAATAIKTTGILNQPGTARLPSIMQLRPAVLRHFPVGYVIGAYQQLHTSRQAAPTVLQRKPAQPAAMRNAPVRPATVAKQITKPAFRAIKTQGIKEQMRAHNMEHGACGVGIQVSLDRTATHEIVKDGLSRLADVEYRAGFNEATGESDGAGIHLYGLPTKFFQQAMGNGEFNQPAKYAPEKEPVKAQHSLEDNKFTIGQYFLPKDKNDLNLAKLIIEKNARENGLEVIGWRSVDNHINPEAISPAAMAKKPALWQATIVAKDAPDLELASLKAAAGIANEAKKHNLNMNVVSQSSKGIVYKGMVPASKMSEFYLDLQSKDFTAYAAKGHSRFATGTSPQWANAQPFRIIAHNGEMNTRNSNAKEMALENLQTGGMMPDMRLSDSNQFDDDIANQLAQGKSLAEAFALLMPPVIADNDPAYSPEIKAMLKYFTLLRTPYNGPAFVVASYNDEIVCKLDSIGLRPTRWSLIEDSAGKRQFNAYSDDDLKTPRSQLLKSGHLGPGDFIIVTKSGDILHTKEVLENIQQQYAAKGLSFVALMQQHVVEVDGPKAPKVKRKKLDTAALSAKLGSAYWDRESTHDWLVPMALHRQEKIGAMGNDTSILPSLSGGISLHISYLFHQLFVQVTAPPLDSIRELPSFNLSTTLGGDVTRSPDAKVLSLKTPILAENCLLKIEQQNDVATEVLHTIFKMPELLPDGSIAKGKYADNMQATLRELLKQAETIARKGGVIILSDRKTKASHATIPDVIAVAAIKKHLEQLELSQNVSIICDSYQIVGVHQAAILLTMGARAVYPRGAYEKIHELTKTNPTFDGAAAEYMANYQHAIEKSLLKIMAKVGITDFNNYSNGGFVAAMGINLTDDQSESVHDNLSLANIFQGIYSPVKGLKLEDIAVAVIHNHARAYGNTKNVDLAVGHFKPESQGIDHGFGHEVVNSFTDFFKDETILANKKRIHDLLEKQGIAMFNGDYSPENGFLDSAEKDSDGFYPKEYLRRFKPSAAFKGLSSRVAEYRENHPTSIYDMLEAVSGGKPSIDISEVEPVDSILAKIYAGDMSQGALTIPAHKTITRGANAVGAMSSSGEGGQDPSDIEHPLRGTKSNQIASGRFGVSAKQIRSAKIIGVKEAQGAKPGEGGEAPGEKMRPEFAAQRGSLPGVRLISPAPHQTKYSIEDTEGLIYYLESVAPKVVISEKIVATNGIGSVATGLAKARAREINIAGNSGGTGAASLSSIKNTGMPSELGLAEADISLREAGLRGEVKLRTSGGFKTADDIIKAAINGADSFEIGTAMLLTVGCIQQRTCNKSCEPGVATDAEKFKGEQVNVERYLLNLAASVRERLAEMGVKNLDELNGRTDLLRVRNEKAAQTFDFSLMLDPRPPITLHHEDAAKRAERLKRKDDVYVTAAKAAFASGKKTFTTETPIELISKDRAFGARFAGEMYKYLEKNPESQAILFSTGSAGQGFGFVNPVGVTLKHTGPVQDGCGECMTGGKIVIKTPQGSPKFLAHENTIAGNSLGYGMSGGELYTDGRAGHRAGTLRGGTMVFAGGGVYTCANMTEGTAMIYGDVANGLGAGSSGGVIFAYDDKKNLASKLSDAVRPTTEEETPAYKAAIRQLLENLYQETGSAKARQLLDNFDREVNNFQVILPKEMDKICTLRGLNEVYKTYNIRTTPISIGMQVWLEQKSLAIIRNFNIAENIVTQVQQKIQELKTFIATIKNPANKVPLQEAAKTELLTTAQQALKKLIRNTPVEYLGLPVSLSLPYRLRGFGSASSVSKLQPVEQRLSSVAGVLDEEYTSVVENIGLYAAELGKKGGGCSGCGAQSCAGVGVPTGCSAEKPINSINAKLKELGAINGRPTAKQLRTLREAFELQISKTPFIAFTGAACPAPCEDACTESIPDKGAADDKRAGKELGQAVSIKNIEYLLYHLGRTMGWFEQAEKSWNPEETTNLFGGDFQKRSYDAQMRGFRPAFARPQAFFDKELIIIGSGPAAMEIAYLALKDGVKVRMYEKSDKAGGLLMDGIPAHKFDKEMVNWHFEQLKHMGLELHLSSEVEFDKTLRQFKVQDSGEVIADEDNEKQHVVLCPGAGKPKELPADVIQNLPKTSRGKIVQAVDFLKAANNVAYALKQNPALDVGALTKREFGGMSPLDAGSIYVIGGGDSAQDVIRNAAKYLQSFKKNGQQGIEIIVRGDAQSETRGISDAYPNSSTILRKENRLRDEEVGAVAAKRQYLTEPENIALAEDGRLEITVRNSVYDNFATINADPEAKKLYEQLPRHEKPTEVLSTSKSTADMVILALGFEGAESLPIVKKTHGIERTYLAGDAAATQSWIIVGAQKSGHDTYTNKIKPDLQLNNKTLDRVMLQKTVLIF